MASKNSSYSTSLTLFFTFNVLFFTLTASTDCGCNPSPKPPIHVPNPMPPVHVPSPLVPSPKPPVHVPSPMPPVHVPSPLVPSPNPPVHVPSPMPPMHIPSPSVSSPNPPMYVPSPSVPSPNPKSVPPPSTPSSSRNCPINVLKLGACGDILSGLLNLQLGQPSSQQCCSLVQGLVDLEVVVCLCTALRANVLGINLDVSVSLSVLLNKCNRKVSSCFECT